MAQIPHLSLPIRMLGDRLATVEQDTVDELAINIDCLCRFGKGERAEDVEFGLLPMPFSPMPPMMSLSDIESTIAIYEPRATVDVSFADYNAADPTAGRISIMVSMPGDEVI